MSSHDVQRPVCIIGLGLIGGSLLRDLAAYAATGEPLECAGAFTWEAIGGWFIDHIEGDPSSVIGLSLPVVRRASKVKAPAHSKGSPVAA